MKTTFDILTTAFEVLNVEAVTDLLTGGIHKNKRTEKNAVERKSDIVLVPLPLQHSTDIVDFMPLNVNIYVPSLSNNQVDEAKLKEITENVIEAIEGHSDSTNYKILEIESQDLITDDREQTFVNLRINALYEQ